MSFVNKYFDYSLFQEHNIYKMCHVNLCAFLFIYSLFHKNKFLFVGGKIYNGQNFKCSV